MSDVISALRDLARAVGELPENGRGTIQGEDLNRAYTNACEVLAASPSGSDSKRCNCSDRAPTIPVYRDRNTHLQDCPEFLQQQVRLLEIVGREQEQRIAELKRGYDRMFDKAAELERELHGVRAASDAPYCESCKR